MYFFLFSVYFAGVCCCLFFVVLLVWFGGFVLILFFVCIWLCWHQNVYSCTKHFGLFGLILPFGNTKQHEEMTSKVATTLLGIISGRNLTP